MGGTEVRRKEARCTIYCDVRWDGMGWDVHIQLLIVMLRPLLL
jgi:hypothetical protein